MVQQSMCEAYCEGHYPIAHACAPRLDFLHLTAVTLGIQPGPSTSAGRAGLARARDAATLSPSLSGTKPGLQALC